MGLSQRVLGQLPSRKTAPQIIAPWIIAPWMIAFPGYLSPGQLPPRIIARRRIASLENCPLIINFPLKIVAPTQATSPQRVLRVN